MEEHCMSVQMLNILSEVKVHEWFRINKNTLFFTMIKEIRKEFFGSCGFDL